MGHDELGLLRPVVLHPHLPFLAPGAHQHERPLLLRDLAQAPRVRNRLDLVHQLQVREVVDEDLVVEDDDDAVAAEADGADLGAKEEVADAAGLVVVPDHDLVCGVAGAGAAADEDDDVAAEEHGDDADAAAGVAELAAENLAERVAAEDPEPVASAGGETAVVLVERQVEKLRRPRLSRRRRDDRRFGSGFGFGLRFVIGFGSVGRFRGDGGTVVFFLLYLFEGGIGVRVWPRDGEGGHGGRGGGGGVYWGFLWNFGGKIDQGHSGVEGILWSDMIQ
ncbi:putative autophagy-related protein 18a [Iris pallida]|uniref:Autophagy-related protein 18a n=1 Tax=Iris pallida TaxID=29817 RepID=A0AAX6GI57_IRIPA|nr:putative autophagy-related protein 18a [Iris pallida]